MRVLAFLLVFLCGQSFAANVTFTQYPPGITSVDSSCDEVKKALIASMVAGSYYPTGCTDAVVGVGTMLSMANSSGAYGIWIINGMNAPAPAFTLASAGSAIFTLQASSSSLQATVANLQTAVTALQSSSGGSGSVEPFDYVKAAALFSFFFSFVVGVWIVGKNIGLIINAVRHW